MQVHSTDKYVSYLRECSRSVHPENELQNITMYNSWMPNFYWPEANIIHQDRWVLKAWLLIFET